MAEPLVFPAPATDPPAGPDLEHEASFVELKDASEGKPERQFGRTLEPAVPPDWRAVVALSTALLGRTRNLRVMVLLAAARLNLNDLPGFAAAVATIRQHLAEMWVGVHPQIDPDDTDSPLLQRSNVLEDLTNAGTVLRPLRDVVLATAPRARPVRWRDIGVLTGAIEAEPGREPMTEAAIRGTFAAAAPDQVAAQHAALDSALADLDGIRAVFAAQATDGTEPNFEPLEKLLRTVRNDLIRYEDLAKDAIVRETAPDVIPEAEAEASAAPADTARPVRTLRAAPTIRAIAAVDTRDDALHALTLAAAYFRTHEPSSPLPLLIDRAARLAPLSFLDILRDLAPDGVQQAQVIAGRSADEG